MPTEIAMCSKEQRIEGITLNVGNKIDQLNSWIDRLGLTICMLREKTGIYSPGVEKQEGSSLQPLLDSTKLSSFSNMLSMEINKIDNFITDLEDFLVNV